MRRMINRQEMSNLPNHAICKIVIAVSNGPISIFIHNSKGSIVSKVLMLKQKKGLRSTKIISSANHKPFLPFSR